MEKYKNPFQEYLKESESDKADKGYAWSTAIGLQAVDGLKPSKYLIDIAIQNIEGKITLQEVKDLIDRYYEGRPEHSSKIVPRYLSTRRKGKRL